VTAAATSGQPAAKPEPPDAARQAEEADRIRAAFRGSGLVLGVDAGGTGTRAVLLRDGVPERRLSTGPFNYLLDRDGTERLARLIREAGAPAAGIGVPGIARQPGSARSLERAISAASGAHVVVGSDATVAWLGAFLGAPGIVVIAGTGSVAVGGSRGATVRAGGHGYLIGDEGGGYWIGRRALRAALSGAEGAGPPTQLAEAIPAAAGCTLDELVVRVHREPRDRTILASLAPVVARCASGPDGDPVAREIIAVAAGALASLAQALRHRLGSGLPVAGVGGVFGIGDLRAEFSRRTGARVPLAPPEVGAALMAITERAD
jgi:glucosamine kinase